MMNLSKKTAKSIKYQADLYNSKQILNSIQKIREKINK